ASSPRSFRTRHRNGSPTPPLRADPRDTRRQTSNLEEIAPLSRETKKAAASGSPNRACVVKTPKRKGQPVRGRISPALPLFAADEFASEALHRNGQREPLLDRVDPERQ